MGQLLLTVIHCALQEAPLRGLLAPLLFISGERDERCRPLCIAEACTSGRLSTTGSHTLMLPVRVALKA